MMALQWCGHAPVYMQDRMTTNLLGNWKTTWGEFESHRTCVYLHFILLPISMVNSASQDLISLGDFSFCLSPPASAVNTQPIHHSEPTSISEGERMVHTEESRWIVSKLTFRNVSCFVCVAFGFPQRSAAFPAVRNCSLNKNQKGETGKLGYLCYCYRQAPFSVLL